LLIGYTSFSQQSNPAPTLAKQDYLQKSKNRKKVARIMSGGGAALILTGIIIPKGDIVRENFLGPEYENDGIKSTFYFCGAVSMLGSIPFIISSNHNKKKAAALSFKNETVPQIQKNSFVYKYVPALTLKISL
jgi:hypothetical protein